MNIRRFCFVFKYMNVRIYFDKAITLFSSYLSFILICLTPPHPPHPFSLPPPLVSSDIVSLSVAVESFLFQKEDGRWWEGRRRLLVQEGLEERHGPRRLWRSVWSEENHSQREVLHGSSITPHRAPATMPSAAAVLFLLVPVIAGTPFHHSWYHNSGQSGTDSRHRNRSVHRTGPELQCKRCLFVCLFVEFAAFSV